ncbi:hypothetical protein M430DRAFT_36966 [Amorphotheca resinae ATCC 22711]|jgi:hypothetical protein|uniref:Uncharacterized protein n=1 Tax=Amorphotheca resinae ATCC 22711 TaxID=857342 RepID=A0A2T3ATB6_AMORE|nr:hypothetical protein M430DRAFT_36966 [Amorphotheca resinae ATCC 22711]PSS10738.1 hypothetical protein M430DRAFT_36966 [Amorphotheca resinae ATCC 22711]
MTTAPKAHPTRASDANKRGRGRRGHERDDDSRDLTFGGDGNNGVREGKTRAQKRITYSEHVILNSGPPVDLTMFGILWVFGFGAFGFLGGLLAEWEGVAPCLSWLCRSP